MATGWALLLWVILSWWMAIGNTAGFHRLLAHKSFKTGKVVRWALTLGSAVHAGSPMQWVGVHRIHHTFSDTDTDPHTPRKGFWWAHSGWLFMSLRHPLSNFLYSLSGFGLQVTFLVDDVLRLLGRRPPFWRRMCRDLMNERLMVVLDVPLVITGLFALQVWAAWAIGGWMGILWLWALHMVQNNASWVVNSFCHVAHFGYADRESGDGSRNVPWLAWLTCGDSFHHNHHAYASSAWHALGSGADPAWWFICALSRLGLASDLKVAPGHEVPRWAMARPAVPVAESD